MSATFDLAVYTPDRTFLKADITEIVFDSKDGSIGVMAGHVPMIAAVVDGTLDILADGEWKAVAVGQGFTRVSGTKAEFFVYTAEWADEIDAVRAKEALRRAEERLRGDINHAESVRTRAAIARAMARLKATERYK